MATVVNQETIIAPAQNNNGYVFVTLVVHVVCLLLLQSLLDQGWICHMSGNPGHKFVYGYYIYHLVDRDKSKGLCNVCYVHVGLYV